MANFEVKKSSRFQGLVEDSAIDRDGASDARYKQYIQIIYTPVSSFSFHTCTDSSFIYKLTLPKVQALKD
jgi:hypothetical protein